MTAFSNKANTVYRIPNNYELKNGTKCFQYKKENFEKRNTLFYTNAVFYKADTSEFAIIIKINKLCQKGMI